MRELKFRQPIYTNGIFERWHYWGFIGEHYAGPASGISISLSEAKDSSQQFTGLHDKNGVPIYEGDIVMWPNDYPGSSWPDPEPPEPHNDFGLIGFDAQDGGFVVDANFKHNREKFCWNLGNALEDCGPANEWEVIANAYENPDYLTGYKGQLLEPAATQSESEQAASKG